MAEVELRPPSSLRLGGGSRDDRDDVFKDDSHANVSCTDSRINTRFRHFSRVYIISQLRKHGFNELANKHSNCESCDDSFEQVLHHLAGNLAEERKHQFEEMLVGLRLTHDSLSETYHVIVREMFADGVNWGRILTFLVFSGSLAVFCAREKMGERVGDVIVWTENVIEKTITNWVDRQGGWTAFVDHFDDGSWTIEPPTYIAASVIAVLVVAGLYVLKKLF